MKKAIDIIEFAPVYYLLSKDHPFTNSAPILIGSRIKLEFALQDIDADMVIATSGNRKKCVVLLDYTDDEILVLANRAERTLFKIRSKN